jgi:YggT family protein
MHPIAALLSMLIGIYVHVVLLRFFMQYFRVDFYNPLSQFVVKATDVFIKPLRKVIPGFAGLDFSSLVLAWLLIIVKMLVVALLNGGSGAFDLILLLTYSLLGLFQSCISLFMFLIIVRAIASWVSPGGYNPALAMIGQLTEPLMAKVRKLLPPAGGFDLSPMLILLVLYFIDYSISYYFY